MNIYSPVLVKLSDGIVTDEVSNSVTSGMIETAIQNALRNTIITPFQTWALNTWIKFVGVSYFVCLGVAMVGGITYIVGIDKGKKIAILATVTYLGVQLLNWFIIGG